MSSSGRVPKSSLLADGCLDPEHVDGMLWELGALWPGEILNQKEKVNSILDAPDSLELMAVLAIGHPVEKDRTSTRKGIGDVTFNGKYGKVW